MAVRARPAVGCRSGIYSPSVATIRAPRACTPRCRTVVAAVADTTPAAASLLDRRVLLAGVAVGLGMAGAK